MKIAPAVAIMILVAATSSIAQPRDGTTSITGGGTGVDPGGVLGGPGRPGGPVTGPGRGQFNNIQMERFIRLEQLHTPQGPTAAGGQARGLLIDIPQPPAVVNGLIPSGASAPLPPGGSLPMAPPSIAPSFTNGVPASSPVQIFIQAPAAAGGALSASAGAATPSAGGTSPGVVAPSIGNDDADEVQPSSATAPSALATVGISPLNFNDLDNGLRDCDIPFAELEQKSPFCRGAKPGEQCIRFSYNQFPEILRLSVSPTGLPPKLCTGTLIAPNWILTAAHCFISAPTSSYITNGRDLVINPGASSEHVQGAIAEALNAKLLDYSSRARRITQVFVHSKYADHPTYANDLAVARIATAYPATAVAPARLAKDNEFSEFTTQAGYGYSNYGGGTSGQFNLTWIRVARKAGLLSFNPQDNKMKTGFCQGDSGGPVLAGYYRGCKPADLSPEQRPRLLQGVISHNFPGKGEGDTEEMRYAQACMASSSMVMQDVTIADRRRWICRVTGDTALGCR